MRRHITVPISVLVLSASLCAGAAAITVTTTSDEDNTNPGACSLREAVTAINTASSYGGCTFAAGDTTVNLPASGTAYTVSLNASGRIEVNVPMTIAGAGPTSTTIQASSLDDDLVFVNLSVNGTVTLQGLALTGAVGNSFGGNAALFVIAQTNRNLVLQDVTIRDNQPTAVPAFNIQGNSAGHVDLTRVIFQNNDAVPTEFSGSSGAAMRCTVGNSNSPPSVTMTDVAFIDNSIASAQDDNVPAAGLVSTGCNLSLTNVTFDTNTASTNSGFNALAGAMIVTDYFGSTTTVTLTNVTFFGNSGDAAGAIYETIAGSGGGAGFTMTLTNVTFAQNTASSAGGGDHIFQDNGAGANLRNVLFGPTAGDDCAGNPSPSFTLGGGNLDSDGTCGAEQTSATPGLAGALADNGGFTETLALTGGDAVDAGTNTGCPATDQRGASRPIDGDGDSTATCDVGAFELNPPGTVQFSSPTYTVNEGDGFAVITITRTGGTGGPITVDFSPVAGGSATEGSDYTGVTSLPVSFADGDGTPKMVQVPITDDPDVEPSETVDLELSGSPLGTPSTAVLTILDNDAPSPAPKIPTLGRWGLALLLATLAGAAVWRLRSSG
jgi:CSLREA domain-containing protein